MVVDDSVAHIVQTLFDGVLSTDGVDANHHSSVLFYCPHLARGAHVSDDYAANWATNAAQHFGDVRRVEQPIFSQHFVAERR